MEHADKKIRYAFWPFLIGLGTSLVLVTAAHWLLLLQSPVLPIPEFFMEYALPVLISGVIAWVFIRSRMRYLHLKRKKGSLKTLYTMVAWFGMALPVIMMQFYVPTATGKLTTLERMDQLGDTEETRYCKVKYRHLAKDRPAVFPEYKLTGRYNNKLTLDLFVAIPMFTSLLDTGRNVPDAWLGKYYSHTVSNALSDFAKERAFTEFLNETNRKFDREYTYGFQYLELMGKNTRRTGLEKAIASHPRYQAGSPLFIAHYEPFSERTKNRLAWIGLVSFTIAFIWIIMVLAPKYVDPAEILAPHSTDEAAAGNTPANPETVWHWMRNYPVTSALAGLNLMVYLVMGSWGLGWMQFSASDLMQWGANFGPAVAEGEWWRLFTSTFLHGGLMHLVANLYGLFFIGLVLEQSVGKPYFLSVYLFSGLVGSLSSILWHDATVAVGASGAIFGMYGFFLACVLTKTLPSHISKAFLTSILLFAGVNLLLGMNPGIDNAAHIGGMLAGFIMGIVLLPALNRHARQTESTGR